MNLQLGINCHLHIHIHSSSRRHEDGDRGADGYRFKDPKPVLRKTSVSLQSSQCFNFPVFRFLFCVLPTCMWLCFAFFCKSHCSAVEELLVRHDCYDRIIQIAGEIIMVLHQALALIESEPEFRALGSLSALQSSRLFRRVSLHQGLHQSGKYSSPLKSSTVTIASNSPLILL